MSNPTVNPGAPQGADPRDAATGGALARFFAWVRRSGMMRGDDRWAGGVCSGLAKRLGWSPTLVRALMAASVLVFGFGAALYGIAWLLMPDERDGHILLEELFAERWDWACVGAFACLLAAILLPGVGLAALVLAALALWALAASGMRANRAAAQGKGNGYAAPGAGGFESPGTPAQPYRPGGPASWPTASAQPVASQAWNATPAPQPLNTPQSGASAQTGPGNTQPLWQPMPQPQPQPAPQAQPAPQSMPQAQSQPQPAWQPSAIPTYRMAPAPSPNGGPAPADWRAPQPAPAPPRYARRKPAGPLLVLLMLGLILVSGATAAYYLAAATDSYLTDFIRVGLIWICGVCVALGLVIISLGAMGRRSGGLVPISWIAGFMAVVMITTYLGFSIVSYESDRRTAGWSQITISAQGGDYASQDGTYAGGTTSSASSSSNDWSAAADTTEGFWTTDASPQSMDRLAAGVAFSGFGKDSYATTRANIDLTSWGRWRNYDDATCPTGIISVAANRTRVFVTLPDGCPYAFGEEQYGGYLIGVPSIGGRHAMVMDNSSSLNFGDDPSIGGYEENYSWLDDEYSSKIPQNAYLYINVVSLIEAKVTVQYVSESEQPGFAEFGKAVSASASGDHTMFDWHVGVAAGTAQPNEQPAAGSAKDDKQDSSEGANDE